MSNQLQLDFTPFVLPKLRPTQNKLTSDAIGVIEKMGRVPYFINFVPGEDEYVTEVEVKKKPQNEICDAESGKFHSRYRYRVKTADLGNAWSSYAYIIPGWHLPVVDVDHADEGIRHEVLERFEYVHGGPVMSTWVPSTTEGHFHLYVDTPFHWDDYTAVLQHCAYHGWMEDGYVLSSLRRGATFVRMPHVKKEPSPEVVPTPKVDQGYW